MGKLFTTSDDIAELAQKKFEETGLAQIGIDLKVISITKANAIASVSKASAITEFRTHGDGTTIHLIIYEEALDRLDESMKGIVLEGALSNVSYDSEKDKINVDNSKYGELFRMRRKYPNYADVLETTYFVMDEIAEEEKQRKAEEREKKAAEKAMKNKQ